MSAKFEYFGKYILFDKLAMGGMAEVYRGRAPGAEGIGKIVAVKRILPQYTANQEFIDMFKSEAKIAINITHGNVAQIYEFGEEQKQFYIVMEFIDGRNLRQVLSRCNKAQKALTIEQCVFVIAQVASGLDYAHRCTNKNTGASLNIIHRDVSPQNIMLSFEGEVKMIDFGIAKAESKIESTRTGTLKGKFGYMSPEQAEGLDLDCRTDIFSLGIVLWELLSGERLFVANNEVNTIRKIRECQIPSLRKINPNIHEELERIANKALAKDRSLRYQTAAELNRDLSRYLYKVNPEFTPHELSIFLKSLFKEDILEDRKKMNELSKAVNQRPNREEKTFVVGEFTHTQTETSTQPSRSQSVPSDANKGIQVPSNLIPDSKIKVPEELDLSAKINRIELQRNVQIANQGSTRVTGAYNFGRTNTGPVTRPTGTYSGVWKRESLYSKYRSYIFVLLFVAAGAYLYNNPALRDSLFRDINSMVATEGTMPPANVQTTVQNSVKPTTARVFIKSIPMGAQIALNDVDLNQTTPAEITVPLAQKVNFALRKDGYLTYVKEFEATKDPEELIATLQRAQFGYINIEVIPANADIYINGQKLAEKSPIRKYPVPAGTPLKIWAINPFMNTQAKTVVVVKKDLSKTVKLYLTKSK